jgi:GTP-binding protein EngB required for normal cell division
VNHPEEIQKLAKIAEEIGSATIRQEADELWDRLSNRRFFLAVVGQFKRGKSTLINALIGRKLLPFGVAPVTSVVTILRFGEKELTQIHLKNGDTFASTLADIPLFVTEKENPENRKGVLVVEAFVKDALLKTGLCIVDTPGLGSVFHGATDITRAFVPQIDAALAVIGADPPISGEELDLIFEVSQEVPEFIFVLNKADRVSETDRKEATDFSRKVIQDRLKRVVNSIFEISSSEAMDGKVTRDWSLMVDQINLLARSRANAVLQHSEDRGIRRITQSLHDAIDERERALKLSNDQIAARVSALYQCNYQIERSVRQFGYVFDYRKHRLEESLTNDVERFLKEVEPALTKNWVAFWTRNHSENGSDAQRTLTDLAGQFVGETLVPLEQRLLAQAKDGYQEISEIYLVQIKTLIRDIFKATESPRFRSVQVTIPETQFATDSSFHDAGAGGMFGGLFSKGPMNPRVLEWIDGLLHNNSKRLAQKICAQAETNFTKLGDDLLKQIKLLSRLAEESFQYAKTKLSQGPSSADLALQRLESIRQELTPQHKVVVNG